MPCHAFAAFDAIASAAIDGVAAADIFAVSPLRLRQALLMLLPPLISARYDYAYAMPAMLIRRYAIDAAANFTSPLRHFIAVDYAAVAMPSVSVCSMR